ncbi:hypothetical protein QQF64_020323 [Cirrhinus molitorella]|uniref:Uncharacterized protein n=1 Tax=Cirrhinus molitorella TaxID=172907 RepID=A0ABR3LCT4_9TELE
MRNPTTALELVEAIELADAAFQREAGERALLFQSAIISSAKESKVFLPITCVNGDTRQVPGDRVMVLVPNAACKFLATWQKVGRDQGPTCRSRHLRARGCRRQPPSFSCPEEWASPSGRSVLGCVLFCFGQTSVLQHDIRTPPGVIVRQWPYRVHEARRQAIEEEVQQILKLGVIEPSRSPWSSLIVMVPKPDGTLRFCNDFRLPHAPSG